MKGRERRIFRGVIIQTLSVLSRSTFGINYSLLASLVQRHKLCKPGFGFLLVFTVCSRSSSFWKVNLNTPDQGFIKYISEL